jgi:hypothetical protein
VPCCGDTDLLNIGEDISLSDFQLSIKSTKYNTVNCITLVSEVLIVYLEAKEKNMNCVSQEQQRANE